MNLVATWLRRKYHCHASRQWEVYCGDEILSYAKHVSAYWLAKQHLKPLQSTAFWDKNWACIQQYLQLSESPTNHFMHWLARCPKVCRLRVCNWQPSTIYHCLHVKEWSECLHRLQIHKRFGYKLYNTYKYLTTILETLLSDTILQT